MSRLYILFGSILFIILYFYGCDSLVSNQSKPEVPADHTILHGIFLHKDGERSAAGCDECHGQDLRGGVQTYDGRYIFVQSCYQCHDQLWNTRKFK
ncbi:MAG TPA: hypothetical protein PKD83_14645 [Ignavibacteria bacterium]|nr:hypothetical protein [Ignavibacteria bacterium]